MRALRMHLATTWLRVRGLNGKALKVTSAAAAAVLFILTTGTLVATDIASAPPAEAASEATINVGATSVRVGQSNNLGISLSGFSTAEQAESYQVTLKYVDANNVDQSNGTLSATQSGTTLLTGYSSYSAAKLGFKGTYAQVSAALQTVAWTPATASSGLTLRIGLSVLPGTNKFYDPNSGHYYEYVSSAKSWTAAKADAASRTLFGLNGYLVHIMSKAENDFIGNETSASNIWIGATDAAVEGQWRWAGATIAGESDFVMGYYSGSSSTPYSTATGWGYGSWYASRYNGWSSGEPNDWGGGEDCAVTNWSGAKASWNDLSCSTNSAYLVEYGGAGGTLTALSITKDSSMGASNALATWTSPTGTSTAATQSYSISFNYAISGLGSNDFTNVGTATGCVFTPASSSAAANEAVTVTVSGCMTGTLQPKFLENSVTVSGGLVIPAATAGSVTISAGPASAATSTVVSNQSMLIVGVNSATITVTPKDANGRLLGTGKSVTIASTRGSVSAISDVGNGTYTATLTTGGSVGEAVVSATAEATSINQTVTLTFASIPTILNSSIDSSGSIGAPYSSTITADGFPTPTFSVASGALPGGITLDSTTGELSGTPTEYGDFQFVLRATNAAGYDSTTSKLIHIYREPVFRSGSNLPSTVSVNGSYSGYVTYYGATSGFSIESCECATDEWTHDGLPAGLSLNPETGVVSGYATVLGTYKFVVRAYAIDPTYFGDSTVRTIDVRQAPTWTDSTVDTSAEYGIAYSEQVRASGYPLPTFTKSGTLPPGVALDAETGTLTGTPSASGTYTFTLTATNVLGSTSVTKTIRVVRAPDWTTAGHNIATRGVLHDDYSSTLTAIGDPDPEYTIFSGALPDGLSLNRTTGVISGTATDTGIFNFVIRATNDYGVRNTPTQTIQIGSVPAIINDVIDTTGYVGVPFNERPTFSGYPDPVYSISGDELPAGLNFNEGTGRISGTATQGGTFHVSVRATNFAGSVSTRTYALRIYAEPVYRSSEFAGAALHNDYYSGHVNFFGPVNYYGVESCDCATSATTHDGLPAGLSLNHSTGIVSGNITEPGTYKFVIRGHTSDYDIYSDSPVQTIVVSQAPSWIDSTIGVTATHNTAYTDGVHANGYPEPTYSANGSWPTGLVLNAETGAITGAPTVPGSYTFSITARNGAGSVTSPSYTMIVVGLPVPVDATIAASTLRNTIFADGIAINAYPLPTYRVATGALPPGVTLNQSTGALVGTPTTYGTYTFAFGVSAGTYYSMTTPMFTLNVEQAPVATDTTVVPIAPVGRAYSDAVAADAFPAATYSVTAGRLPTGLTLNATTGEITGTATVPGDYTFTVTATNLRGSVAIPLDISAHDAPGKPILTLAPRVVLGEAVNGYTAVTGFPSPTFYIAGGALPNGVTINRTTGRITGTPTQAGTFNFTVGALNDQGSAQSSPFELDVTSPGANIDIAVPVGDPALGAPVQVQSEGLAPSVDYTVTVRSTPQVVGSGTTTRAGEILAKVQIPDNLEPGWHSITLTTEAADGSPVEEVAWFEITATGILETVSDNEPSAAEKANALNDDEAFYQKMGIDPGTQVEPAEVANTVQNVSSVVASVALVSAAAAATAAVASAASAASVAAAAGASASAAGSAASAGGAASNSAAGARTATPGGSSSAGGSSSGGGSSSSSGARGGSSSGGSSSGGGSSSSGGSNSSSNSSGGPDGDGGDDSADYGNLEAEHDDFTVDHVSWGDSLAWWSRPFMTALDRISVAATEYTSRISPVLSRIINDGAYLRAIFGAGMTLPYAASLILGAVAVKMDAENLAAAGSVLALSIVLVLGTLDAFAGLLGITSFTIVSVAVYGISGLGDIRYLLAMFIAGFAPIILSTTFRKIRRPKAETLSDVWERVIDVFMIAFVSSLTTLSVVGGISAFAGATVPLADAAKSLVFVITGVALLRIVLEEATARWFPSRLDAINPTEVSGPGVVQPWISLVFKYVVLTVMIGDMVGWGWWLWTGALIMFVPGIMGMTLPELPKSKILTQLIPGGLAALLLATLLSSWSGEIVGALFADSEMYGPLSFLLVPLPVIIVAIVGMFADGGEKWYIERNLKWVYIVGGIGVFASTVWATDFIGQIFG